MTITEIRDELTRLIDQGHGYDTLKDENYPHFQICAIEISKYGTITFECDEVK